MQFEAGKLYRTRDGMKAQVFLIEDDRIFGRVRYNGDHWLAVGWHGNGKKDACPRAVDDFDLIAPWEESAPEPETIEGYINVYRPMTSGRAVCIYASRLQADRNAGGSCVRVAYVRECEPPSQ